MQLQTALTPGLMVLQGNRIEELRQLVLQWLALQPQPPLASDVFLVQSNGIAQWLKLGLAQDAASFGVAMGVDVMLPARFQWQAYRAVLGNLPRVSPYDKAPLTWRLLRLLPELIAAEPEIYRPLALFLQNDTHGRKCFQLAEKIADLFDQYQIYRADWLNGWKAGANSIDNDQVLAAEDLWQPALWRAIVADMPAAQRDSSRADVHAKFVAACGALTPQTRPKLLPARVVLLGITSLAAQQLEVLSAMASCSQVIICVQNPSRHYWGDIVEGREWFQSQYRRAAKKTGVMEINADALHLHGHPLLASWGKQGRDYLRLIDQWDNLENYRGLFAANKLAIDVYVEPQQRGVLQQIQRDILELTTLAEITAEQRILSPEDNSLAFHLAHSPQREVEILHDQLLARLSEDPTLSPRDIMVMVPDINGYAPHIQAVFGQYSNDDARHIPYTIADLGQREHKPLLLAISQMFAVHTQRYRANDVLSWLSVPAIRQRFGLKDEDIEQLRQWVAGSEVRWGLHRQQRAQLGLPADFEQNSWLFGLQRMLLGYIAGDDFNWQGVEAYGEVAGISASLAGGLYDFIQQLMALWRAAATDKTPAQWVELWREQLAALCDPDDGEDSDILQQIELRLAQWLQLCDQAGFDQPLGIDVLRDYLLDGLDESSLQRRFLTGAVNFATLMPMRAIPFRHIYMLGMNDGAFPRQHVVPAFDLMRRPGHYRPGDRSRRDDDRYLFLEALLSARDSLTISYVARNIHDNTERTPSIVVSQLQDHLRAGWQPATNAADCVAQLTTEHPLQPFSRQYFPAQPNKKLFSYAHEWRAASELPAGDTAAMPAWQPNTRQISLAQLVRFFKDPLQHFYANRLGVVIPRFDDQVAQESEPFALNGLESWQLRQQIFSKVSSHWQQHGFNADYQTVVAQQLAKFEHAGLLPLAPFLPLHRDEISGQVSRLLARVHDERQQLDDADTVAIDLLVGDWQIVDALGECYLRDGQIERLLASVSALFTNDSKKHPRWDKFIEPWLAQLLLTCQLKRPVQTRIIHPSAEHSAQDVLLSSITVEQAEQYLAQIVAQYDACLKQPMLLWVELGCEFLQAGASKAEELFVSAGVGLLRARYRQDAAEIISDKQWQQLVNAMYQPLLDAYYLGKDELKQSTDGDTIAVIREEVSASDDAGPKQLAAGATAATKPVKKRAANKAAGAGDAV